MMVEVDQHSVNDKSNDEPEGCLQNSSETWGHRFAFADSNFISTLVYIRFAFDSTTAVSLFSDDADSQFAQLRVGHRRGRIDHQILGRGGLRERDNLA